MSKKNQNKKEEEKKSQIVTRRQSGFYYSSDSEEEPIVSIPPEKVWQVNALIVRAAKEGCVFKDITESLVLMLGTKVFEAMKKQLAQKLRNAKQGKTLQNVEPAPIKKTKATKKKANKKKTAPKKRVPALKKKAAPKTKAIKKAKHLPAMKAAVQTRRTTRLQVQADAALAFELDYRQREILHEERKEEEKKDEEPRKKLPKKADYSKQNKAFDKKADAMMMDQHNEVIYDGDYYERETPPNTMKADKKALAFAAAVSLEEFQNAQVLANQLAQQQIEALKKEHEEEIMQMRLSRPIAGLSNPSQTQTILTLSRALNNVQTVSQKRLEANQEALGIIKQQRALIEKINKEKKNLKLSNQWLEADYEDAQDEINGMRSPKGTEGESNFELDSSSNMDFAWHAERGEESREDEDQIVPVQIYTDQQINIGLIQIRQQIRRSPYFVPLHNTVLQWQRRFPMLSYQQVREEIHCWILQSVQDNDDPQKAALCVAICNNVVSSLGGSGNEIVVPDMGDLLHQALANLQVEYEDQEEAEASLRAYIHYYGPIRSEEILAYMFGLKIVKVQQILQRIEEEEKEEEERNRASEAQREYSPFLNQRRILANQRRVLAPMSPPPHQVSSFAAEAAIVPEAPPQQTPEELMLSYVLANTEGLRQNGFSVPFLLETFGVSAETGIKILIQAGIFVPVEDRRTTLGGQDEEEKKKKEEEEERRRKEEEDRQ